MFNSFQELRKKVYETLGLQRVKNMFIKLNKPSNHSIWKAVCDICGYVNYMSTCFEVIIYKLQSISQMWIAVNFLVSPVVIVVVAGGAIDRRILGQRNAYDIIAF